MNQEEHNLQCACVKWFAYQHPELQGLLFAVPNGGARSKATAGKLKAEGVVPGVADLILFVPCIVSGGATAFHALCIEMKTAKGLQRTTQREWQEKVMQYGYDYQVARSLDDFIRIVESYLDGDI